MNLSNKSVCNILFPFFLLLFFVSCTQDSNTQDGIAELESLSNQADSLYALAKSYSDDSLNQEEALKLYHESFRHYKNTENKRGMAKVYKRIGFAYDYLEDFSKVKEYQKKALIINIEIDNKTESAIILNYLGIANTITGNIDSAFMYYKRGLDLFILTQDTSGIIKVYQNIGITYREAGNYEESIESYIQALNYSEKINYINSIFSLNLNIAQLYQEINDFDMAFSYCEKALRLIDSIDNPYSKASFYDIFGTLYYEKVNNRKALECFEKTLKISQDANYKRGMASAYNNLAMIALTSQNFKDAEKYANLSIELETEINNISGMISSFLRIAEIQYRQKFYDKALIQIQKAEDLCCKKGISDQLPDIYYHFYQVYKLDGQHKSALKFCENYYILKDSLIGEKVKEKIAGIEIKHQTEKKQHKIELLKLMNSNQKKQIITQFLVIGLLIVSTFFAAFIFTQFRKRKLVEIEKMQNDIFEYLTQIDNISKSIADFKSNTKLEILGKIKEFDLTEREQEVLFLIAEGNRNKEIAEKMFISLSTVKTHTTNIFYKLDVKNRIEAIKKTKFL